MHPCRVSVFTPNGSDSPPLWIILYIESLYWHTMMLISSSGVLLRLRIFLSFSVDAIESLSKVDEVNVQ